MRWKLNRSWLRGSSRPADRLYWKTPDLIECAGMEKLDTEKTVKILNTILEHELAGVVRYTHYALMVTGANRLPIVEFMKAQASECLGPCSTGR